MFTTVHSYITEAVLPTRARRMCLFYKMRHGDQTVNSEKNACLHIRTPYRWSLAVRRICRLATLSRAVQGQRVCTRVGMSRSAWHFKNNAKESISSLISFYGGHQPFIHPIIKEEELISRQSLIYTLAHIKQAAFTKQIL